MVRLSWLLSTHVLLLFRWLVAHWEFLHYLPRCLCTDLNGFFPWTFPREVLELGLQ